MDIATGRMDVNGVPEGYWEREASHFPQPLSPLTSSLQLEAQNESFRKSFAAVGALVEGLEFREINGWVYTRLVPLGGKDRKSPPRWLFWLLARTVPEMRRRIGRNKKAIRTDLMGRIVNRWHEEWKPQQISKIHAVKQIGTGELTDGDLGRHWAEVTDWFQTSLGRHFWLAMPMSTIAELAFFCEDHLGWEGRSVMRLFAGLSTTSTAPGRELAKLAALANDRSAVRQLIEAGGRESVERLEEADPDFAAAFGQYQHDFGCRALRYEFAEPSLGEIPELTLSLIRDQLVRRYDPAEEAAVTAETRRAAGDEARSLLHGNEDLLSEFDRLVARAKQYYPVREDNEFYTVSAPIHFVRHAALELGRRMAAAELLTEPEDVFFLTGEELPTAFREGRPQHDIVIARKEERERVLANPAPPSFGTPPGDPPPLEALPQEAAFSMRAVVWATNNVFEQAPPEPEPSDDPSRIRGRGAAPGSYSGPARVIMDESEFGKIQAGDVLVCPITSPVWSIVFPSVGALVTDTGGILSHPAIIAREYGIPAVVATRTGTSTIRDGQTVSVDGDSGIVTIQN